MEVESKRMPRVLCSEENLQRMKDGRGKGKRMFGLEVAEQCLTCTIKQQRKVTHQGSC